MRPNLLANKPPDYDVPGDIYAFNDLPPRPRVKWQRDGTIENVNLDTLQLCNKSDYEVVPGLSGIMWQYGECLGVSKDEAVWRFGFAKESKLARAFDCYLPFCEGQYGFAWVLAKRRSGKVIEEWFGWANDMPAHFETVINSAVIMRCPQGYMQHSIFFAPTTHHIGRNDRDPHDEGFARQ